MTLFDLDSLSRDPRQDNLYNFFDSTFRLTNGYQQEPYIVGLEEQMRIDIISNITYKNIDHVDFLCSLNDVDNPLNVKQGDVIYYTSFGAVDAFRIRFQEQTETRNALVNANKSTKVDKNRQKYIEDNYSLPPTLLPTPKAPVRIEGNDIVIGG